MIKNKIIKICNADHDTNDISIKYENKKKEIKIFFFENNIKCNYPDTFDFLTFIEIIELQFLNVNFKFLSASLSVRKELFKNIGIFLY